MTALPKNILDDSNYRDQTKVFANRDRAGQALAEMLRPYLDRDLYLLAIPAGGAPVARVIADELGLPSDLLVTSKITFEWMSESGYGAVSHDGRFHVDEDLIERFGLSRAQVEADIRRTRRKVADRIEKLRGDRDWPDLSGRTVVLVDDGIATGETALAAIESLADDEPRSIWIATPTASFHAVQRLARRVDCLIALNIRSELPFAVADAYEDWRDISDDELVALLRAERATGQESSSSSS